ncbi:cytochrome P450 [Bauldia litoralis]|uniref:Cytochrome P450 n=1 Tax=Bauldia litoralis TaxID=665467 RepID=A0A1G6D652_9HYPH|nr:cytochrome P450 [Bauldia litoralis]SDB40637.1 Cytochrome P450 [Bauldia litoralis]
MNDVARASGIDTNTPAFADNPAAHYADLRSKCPVSWQPSANAWLLTRYDDVVRVLRDPHMSHVGILDPWLRIRDRHGIDFKTAIQVISAMPFNYEGAQHAEGRRRVARAIATLADRDEVFAAAARRLLDRARRDGGFDFAEDFANRLLFEVLCDLAEIETAHRPLLYPLSRLSWTIEATLSIRDRQAMEDALLRAFELLTDRIPVFVRQSPDSLLARLHNAIPETEPDRVAATIDSFCVMLLMGNDALGGAMSTGVSWLLDPEQNKGETVPQKDWGRLSDDLLRHGASVDFLTRVTSSEKTFGDVVLPAGSRLMTSPPSANRDTAKFGPDADRISLSNHHGVGLTFGAGRHVCVGMQMSKRIVTAALDALAEAPELRLAGKPKRGKGTIIRTLGTMPVEMS